MAAGKTVLCIGETDQLLVLLSEQYDTVTDFTGCRIILKPIHAIIQQRVVKKRHRKR